MARIIFNLSDDEYKAFLVLSEMEFREPKAQAALIIRRELEAQGLLESVTTKQVINPPAQEPSDQGAADQIIQIESE